MSDLGPVELAPPWPWLIVGAQHRHMTTPQECGCVPVAGPALGVCEDPED